VRVHAFFSAIRALPKPSVEVLFDSLNEVGASDVYTPNCLAISVSRVSVNVNFCRFSFEFEVMREFTLLSLLTNTRFKEGT
jgi:hypothetical protein